MERLEILLAEIEKVSYTGNKICLHELIEKLNELIYYLEAQGPESDKALLHIQACCWMLYEDKHTATDEKRFLTFYYIKDKAFRACATLFKQNHKERTAA